MPQVPVVLRSKVPARLEYIDYKQELRYDFFYSCAYCHMSECEAQTIDYEIDHFVPRNEAPELVAEYDNLMYACNICNGRKSDLYPPLAARQNGIRFYKSDQDAFDDHFHFPKYEVAITEIRYEIEGKTGIGRWTTDALDLNREILLRLRKIRDDLNCCDAYVQKGITALKDIPLDSLPQRFRARTQAAIYRIDKTAQRIVSDVDELLRKNAKSDFADPDNTLLDRMTKRKESMAAYVTQFPGKWRAPRKESVNKRSSRTRKITRRK